MFLPLEESKLERLREREKRERERDRGETRGEREKEFSSTQQEDLHNRVRYPR